MFGIGTPELLVILAVALIVLGPKKLPELAKSLGRALGEFKRATNDLKQSLEQESGLDEVRENFKGARQDALLSMSPDEKKESSSADNASAPKNQPGLPAVSDADSRKDQDTPTNTALTEDDEEKPKE